MYCVSLSVLLPKSIGRVKMPRVETRLLAQKQQSVLTALTQIVATPPAHPVVAVAVSSVRFFSQAPRVFVLAQHSPQQQPSPNPRYFAAAVANRNMSAVPHSATSPPTSPPSKRVKTTTGADDDTTIATTMSAAAPETSNNGTAVPTLKQEPPLLIKKLSGKAKLPTRGSAFAAGYDLYAAKETTIPARGKALVDTDISIAVPAGTCKCYLIHIPYGIPLIRTPPPKTDGRIAPRSGLAAKNFIDTGAGVIDADYRGQVKVLLFNHADADFAVAEGDRVAQLIIERIYTPEVVEVAELEASVRGAGGFGSTGAN